MYPSGNNDIKKQFANGMNGFIAQTKYYHILNNFYQNKNRPEYYSLDVEVLPWVIG
jgi:hypothetical protein